MQLSTNNSRYENINLLQRYVCEFYKHSKTLTILNIKKSDENKTDFYMDFLLYGQFLIRFEVIKEDRYDCFATGYGLQMGEGYVASNLFLSKKQYNRLSMNTTKEAIFKNLDILDEYIQSQRGVKGLLSRLFKFLNTDHFKP